MIEVATLAEAQAIEHSDDGRKVIAIESSSPCRVYFEGDTLPTHMVVTPPTAQELLTQLRAAAKSLIVANDAPDKRFKAFVLVVLDEINIIRSKLVPALPARTVEQLRAVMRGKIDAGDAD